MAGFRTWLAVVAVLVAAGIVIPYGVLGGGEPSIDIFAFWCLFGVGVVAVIIAGLRHWRV